MIFFKKTVMSKNIYFVGIGGAGTSSLARIYLAKGYNVMGSDNGDGFYTKPLQKEGIKIFDNFSIDNIPKDVEFVIHSTAFDDRNIEISEFKNRGVKILSYPEALGEIMKEFETIAICGTHGKTTTTAMTAFAFTGAGEDVNVLVGSIIPQWSSGARTGSSKYFIVESDEYQNKLSYYHPKIVVLTSIDYDHPDFFKDFESYKKTFRDFVNKVPKDGIIVACCDDKNIKDVLKDAKARIIYYGEDNFADACIVQTETKNKVQRVYFDFEGKREVLEIGMFGIHNAKNALAAWLVAKTLINKKTGILSGLKNFQGVARRAENKGVYKDALLIDDYAHHPSELGATINSFKKIYKNKNIIAAFHPHTFSRTQVLFDDFVKSLLLADEIIILEIYSSAREKSGNISSKDLVVAINEIEKKAIYIDTIEQLAKWAKDNLKKDDVFITLGAGDIWKVHDKILND